MQLTEMNVSEMDQVDGGLVPIALAAAALATTVEFSFVIGYFDGVAAKAAK